MPEPVEWDAEGSPRSARFGDVYNSNRGALEQARHVFLGGCGLPAAWAGQPQWRILETGFGLGTNFLAAWHAWKEDARRPGLLHFVSAEAWPVGAADIARSAARFPELREAGEALAAQWQGLLPGVHRLSFEQGRVLLTLCVGEVQDGLRDLSFQADSVFLDGFDPQVNPAMWELAVLKAVARLCRRGAGIASWTASGQVRRDLAQCGFQVEKLPGLPPKWHRTAGRFDPRWEPKGAAAGAPAAAGRAVVAGAGIAGAAAAASLARRGWRVEVIDAAATPAQGASGLPAGLFSPQATPDDSVLSRLTRAGVRATRREAQALLHAGAGWSPAGVLEHRADGSRGLPREWPGEGAFWSRAATEEELAQAGLPPGSTALWHGQSGWARPAALVGAWLAQPGISWRGDTRLASMRREGAQWHLTVQDGPAIEPANLVVLAAGPATPALLQAAGLPALPLTAIRGQLSLGAPGHKPAGLPPFPVNGNGAVLPAVPLEDGEAWMTGSTFVRERLDLAVSAAEHEANLQRLRALLPQAAGAVEASFASGEVHAWTGLRCASRDRLPLAGMLGDGLGIVTAMGARGLTFAVLCAEILAARLHGEPMPVEDRLADALDPTRFRA